MLTIYKILFMVELLVAELLFAHRMNKRKFFWLRFLLSLTACILIAVFYPLPDFGYNWWYISIMFFVIFACSLGCIFLSFDCNFRSAFFVSVAAYTAQHISYSISSMIFSLSGLFETTNMYTKSPLDFSSFSLVNLIVVLIYFSVVLLVYGLSYIILSPKLIRNSNITIKSNNVLLFAVLVFVIDIILNSIIVYNTEAKMIAAIRAVLDILCCVLIFYLQLTMIDERNKDIELRRIEEALKQADKQYILQKENINLINIKVHDLKHQISAYANKGGMDEKNISDIKNIISIYDSSIKTGNEVLDIILTEKSLLCSERKIKLSCMVDSTNLTGISDGDLYALFGNIISNSIEAVSKIQDGNKRCIGLHIQTIHQFLSIMIDNYYVGELTFENGLPLTTKENKNDHGYGMKSISLLVDKYQGTLNIKTDKDCFELSILFPLPITEK